MAVPKRKTSKAKMRSRRAAAWKVSAPAAAMCPQCKHDKLPHRVCLNCGYYAGRSVLEVE
jgi:large subunit ribosomal protein L32